MISKTIDYLRLSVTDKCNLNCLYCGHPGDAKHVRENDILGIDEIEKLVSSLVFFGIRRVRVTGGEPLLRHDITDLISMLNGLKGIEEISMTTNGVYLADKAAELKKSGLDRINISIDTLNRDKFRAITGTDSLSAVKDGIFRALDVSLKPLKLNVVVINYLNDDEILEFIKFAGRNDVIIRFIEMIPLEGCSCLLRNTVPNSRIIEIIENNLGRLERDYAMIGNGPAEHYRLQGKISIGFISGMSSYFCNTCNRIRVDSAGRMFSCLFSKEVFELREILQTGSDIELRNYLKNILDKKILFNKNNLNMENVMMSSIGG